MPTNFATELAPIRLAALRKLHDIMQRTESDAEARRCAIAILKAPVLKEIDDRERSPDPCLDETSPVTIAAVHDPSNPEPAEPANDAHAASPPNELLACTKTPPDHAHLINALSRAVRCLDSPRHKKKKRPSASLLSSAGAAPP